jgi:outer membrane autotransporter protein
MWFAQNDSLAKRLGDLRLSHGPHGAYGAHGAHKSHASHASHKSHAAASQAAAAPSAAAHPFALWTRAYAQRLNLSSEVAGRAYHQQLYGIDLGADRPWRLADGAATLHTGLYLGYAASDADYKTRPTEHARARAEAELTSTHGGVYATYQRESGLYIDAILKIASIENTLRAPAAAALSVLEADYNNLNLGLTLEAGKKFPLRGDWQIEPQLQLAYLRILAKDYTAATPGAGTADASAATTLRIAAADMDALQFRLTQTISKTIRLAGGGVLQPYVRIGGAALTSHGGEIRNGNGYQRLRPNIDGTRAEFGAGTVWQLSAAHQLHFDYEASYAEAYSKPWGLTAGYRWQF